MNEALCSVQLADVGRDRLNLHFSQLMRDRLHDGRGVGVALMLILTSFFVPVGQLAENAVRKLTCQPRKCIGAFAVRTMT